MRNICFDHITTATTPFPNQWLEEEDEFQIVLKLLSARTSAMYVNEIRYQELQKIFQPYICILILLTSIVVQATFGKVS